MVSPIGRRALLGAAAFACMLIGSWAALAQSAGTAPTGGASGGPEAGAPPGFTVDPAWPKALPNNWIIGAVAGVAVDKRDHIWIVHRPATIAARQLLAEKNPPETTCCVRAPPVLVFDRDATCSAIGAGLARATSGRRSSTASMWTRTTTSGSPATARRTTTS
jgi:hypothetical protein